MTFQSRILAIGLRNGFKTYEVINKYGTVGIFPKSIFRNDLFINKSQHRHYKDFGHKQKKPSPFHVCFVSFLVLMMYGCVIDAEW